MSQRVEYPWIEAYAICQSNGMRLATIESNYELQNLAFKSNKNRGLFESSIFVDGKNLTQDHKPETCLSISRESRLNFEVKSINCDYEKSKFLCEYVEEVEKYEEQDLAEGDKIDNVQERFKNNFFYYMGEYRE